MEKQISFKDFSEKYKKEYNCLNISIKTQNDMSYILYDLYNTEHFDIDYDNKTIYLIY